VVVLKTGLNPTYASEHGEGRNSGGADFVTKPIDWLNLPQRLENVLAGGSGAWPSS
jgi:DNA-binding response OmpR family regulator